MISSFYEKIVGGSPQPPETITPPKILCVGLACIDIVQTVKSFPAEDSDSRCIDYRWQRGGNASNDCTVLSRLGNKCEFLGTLSAGNYLSFLEDDMKKYSIKFSQCPRVKDVGCPMSTVILSMNTGSRTILHHNPNLPELTLEDFKKINFDDYSWIHFEGRNVANVLSMMQDIEDYNRLPSNTENSKYSRITISVELEKEKADLLDLLPYADVIFLSKDFAQSRGCSNMYQTIRTVSRDVKSGATIICAWGDRGAIAKSPDGTIVQSPAFSPMKIIDSLGAGDTFIAAVIHYLNHAKLQTKTNKDGKIKSKSEDDLSSEIDRLNITKNKNIESTEYCKTGFIEEGVLQSAVMFGCQIAGKKIGQRGFDNIQPGPNEFFSNNQFVI